MSGAPNRGATHLPALDGLRGLAIALVLIFHIGSWLESPLPSLALGYRVTNILWCGVDLFFVLSGFLITRILLEARRKPRYFRNFYMRRVLRIFPLYYATLFMFLVVGARLLPGNEKLQATAGQQVWLWIYASNIVVSLRGSWVFYGMNHFWSLAVEEHFYQFWPLLVFLFEGKRLVRVCLLLIGAALVLRVGVLVQGSYPLAAYAFTLCRMDALALGGLLAVLERDEVVWAQLVRVSRPVAALLCAVLLALYLPEGGINRFPAPLATGAGTLIAAFFGAVLLVAVSAEGWARAFFTSSPLMTLGKYSYGVYIYHHPLRSLFERLMPPRRLADALHSELLAALIFGAGVSALSLAVALVSWNVLEKRFLGLKRFFEPATA